MSESSVISMVSFMNALESPHSSISMCSSLLSFSSLSTLSPPSSPSSGYSVPVEASLPGSWGVTRTSSRVRPLPRGLKQAPESCWEKFMISIMRTETSGYCLTCCLLLLGWLLHSECWLFWIKSSASSASLQSFHWKEVAQLSTVCYFSFHLPYTFVQSTFQSSAPKAL